MDKLKIYQKGDEALQIKALESKLKALEEFVKDCATSHNESRFKYRAQVLLKESVDNESN